MPKYQVKNTATQDVQEYDVPYLRPAALLPVPYVSQIGPGANKYNSDCGAACCTMIMKAYVPATTMTVDQFYDETGVTSGFLSVEHLRQVLARYGIATTYEANMTLPKLFELLWQGKPVIILYKYGVAVDAKLTERKDFRSAHFALAVGIDNKYVYIHDPYCSNESGAARAYPIQIFLEAWNKVGTDPNCPNPMYAGLYPKISIGTLVDDKGSSDDSKQPVGTEKALYKIRVVHPQWINIRTGPGLNFPDIGDLFTNTEREVYEEKPEAGLPNNLWARISQKGQPVQWVLVRFDTSVKI
jgi:hypothetical protein